MSQRSSPCMTNLLWLLSALTALCSNWGVRYATVFQKFCSWAASSAHFDKNRADGLITTLNSSIKYVHTKLVEYRRLVLKTWSVATLKSGGQKTFSLVITKKGKNSQFHTTLS